MTIFLISTIYAQKTSLDCKYSDVGRVGIYVSNTGNSYPGVADGKCEGGAAMEYPVGGRCYYGVWGIWIGSIKNVGGVLVRRVSTGGPYGNPNITPEFYPTAETWDTVWVADQGETIEIPYWPGYTAVSNQDLITRFNDYTVLNPILPWGEQTQHNPQYVDVVQVTYVFNGFDVVVHQFWIIPTREDLESFYFGVAGNVDISSFGLSRNDEYSWYDEENHLGILTDQTGNADDCTVGSSMAFRLYPDVADDSTGWHWDDGHMGDQFPNKDQDKYKVMSSGINHDAIQSTKYGHWYYGVGPFQILKGDTIHFTVAQIHGINLDNVYKNYFNLLRVKENNYRIPSAPPRPPLRVEVGNHQVTLNWAPLKPGDADPENYTDPARLDGEAQPFEGYRLYKSEISSAGPWKMLMEYDRTDDRWGKNLGLSYSFADYGLLNNLTYHYSVTAFSKPDTVMNLESLESSIAGNSIPAVPGTAAPKTVGQVAVVPNPYRGDQKYYDLQPPWEEGGGEYGIWSEEFRRIQFINLPNPCVIKIYTVAGQYVNTIHHEVQVKEGQLVYGIEDWNLTSHVGQTIASGIYIFTVKDLKSGDIQTGKFVVIK